MKVLEPTDLAQAMLVAEGRACISAGTNLVQHNSLAVIRLAAPGLAYL
jgi:hypothetical protein